MNLRVIHDYEAEAFYIMYLSGLKINNDSKLKSILTKMYFCFVMVFMILVSIMCATSGLIVSETIKSLEGIHWTLLVLVVGSFSPIKRSTLIMENLQIIRDGFFTYEDEPPDDRQNKRKEFHVRRARILSKLSFFLVTSTGVVTSFARVFNNPGSGIYDKNINPLFPFPMFMPFDTTTTIGFLFGYFIEELTLIYLVSITVGIMVIFLSVIEQWIAQLKILNMSITNVQERALAIYNSKRKFNDTISVDELLYSKEFQSCVSKCLRQNVMHHHILLRFRNSVRTCIQTIFSLLVIGPVVIFSAMFIVILEIEDISEVSILMFMLGTETVYLFIICYYGDLLKSESEKVFFSLWDTPWWNFDKSNRMTLLIMMANVMEPTVLRAPGLRTDMSIESFGDIMARAYQFMSVIRNVRQK